MNVADSDICKKIKIVEWVFADKCNYHCSYCSSKVFQSESRFSIPPLSNASEFLDELKESLGDGWLIHLGGAGEPLACPEFFEIVKKLIKSGFYLGLVTNFSYPLSDILKFLKIAEGKILYFNASLHLEFADLDSFLEKAIEIQKHCDFQPFGFGVSAVARIEYLPALIRIKEEFERKGINFVFQAEKISSNYVRYRDYSTENVEEMRKKFDHLNNILLSSIIKAGDEFKNKRCLAGRDYFILFNNGETYSCFPYYGKIIPRMRDAGNKKSESKPEGYLGNILSGTFRLNKDELICKSNNCSCSAPWRIKKWREK